MTTKSNTRKVLNHKRSTACEWARGLACKFSADRAGAVILLFALTLIPLMGFIGGAIDYANAYRTRAKLQNALDAAALTVGHEVGIGASNADARKAGMNVLNANLGKDFPPGATIDFNIDGTTVTATGNLKVDTFILGVLGIDAFPVGSTSVVNAGGSSIEVALVVDNSGSMIGSKLSTLESSASDMVKTLMQNSKDDAVKMALVPFSDYVNIGLEHRNEPGIDVPDDYTINKEGGCKNTYPNSTRQCKTKEVKTTCYKDGSPYSCIKKKKYDCTGDKGEPVEKCTYGKVSKYRWYGCVASREAPLNTTDDSYSTEVPGMMESKNNCKYSKLTRLTNKLGVMQSGIKTMKASGYTYIPTGLMWGWRVLSDTAPFADGVPYSQLDKVKKAIVLMTDGANTKSMKLKKGDQTKMNANGFIWAHESKNTNAANILTNTLCDNIKEEGIIIYTIAFDIYDSGVKELISKCAGNGGQYYDASNTSELASAFKKISSSLQSLRLSK